MRYLLSCHKKQTAGYFFDSQIANKTGYRLLVVAPITMLDLPIVILRTLRYGLFGALASTRYEKAIRKKNIKNYAISRDICSKKLLERASFVVIHNIECYYYYLEAQATERILLKIANYLQFCNLKFRDNFSRPNAKKYYYISTIEHRYRRIKGDKSGVIFDVNNDQEIFVNKCKDGYKYSLNSKADPIKAYCYFGNFKNPRTLSDAKVLIRIHPEIKFFGLGKENLTTELHANYEGFVHDINEIALKYTLIIPETFSKVGVQTKAIQWLRAGGNIVGPVRLKCRLSCR